MLVTFDFYHWDLWALYHKITFDGVNKRIYINPEVTSLDVEIDIYSSWKEWSQEYDNLKFLQALKTTGGDPLPGGRRVGQYFFLTNGWKLVPPSDKLISDIELVGNLFADDGSDIFDLTGFDNFRLVRQVVSQFTEIAAPTVTVTGSGLTPSESAKLDSLVSLNTQQTASLTLLLNTASLHTTALNSIIQLQNITTSSLDNIDSSIVTISGSVIELLVSQSFTYSEMLQQSASLANQTQLLTQQSSSLYTQINLLNQQSASLASIENKTDQLLSTSGSLTPQQSTMLFEMYRLLGLDPTRPLIVSPTSRDAGAEISQTISKVGDIVTVTRD